MKSVPVYQSVLFAAIPKYLGLIHIQMFTFASGFLYFMLREQRKIASPHMQFCEIKKRATRLLMPYVIVSLSWAIPFAIWSKDLTIEETFINYVLGVSPNQLWFLLMLFLVNVFFIIFNRIKLEPVYIFLMYTMIGFGLMLSQVVPNYFQFETAFQFFIYFYLGGFIWKLKRNPSIPLILGCSFIHLVLYALMTVVNNKNEFIFQVVYVSIKPLVSVFGIFAIYFLVEFFGDTIVNCVYKTKIWRIIERDSIGIYFFHQQLIYLGILMLNRSGVPPFVLVLLNFIVSTVVSIVITELLWKNDRISILLGFKKPVKSTAEIE